MENSKRRPVPLVILHLLTGFSGHVTKSLVAFQTLLAQASLVLLEILGPRLLARPRQAVSSPKPPPPTPFTVSFATHDLAKNVDAVF